MEFFKHNHESKGTLGPSTPIRQLAQTVNGGASEIQVAEPKDTANAGSYFAQEDEEEAEPEEEINSVHDVQTNSESAVIITYQTLRFNNLEKVMRRYPERWWKRRKRVN